MTDVKVRFVASDEATEVARTLLETLRQLQKEEKATASATGELGRQARAAGDSFSRMVKGLTSTGGLDAVTRRVNLLAEGLRAASTRAESMARLVVIEGQLQKALARTNLTLADRIRLERTLQTTQAALGRGIGPSGPNGPGGVGGVIQNVQQLQAGLAALGVAVAARRLLQLTNDAIDAADAMGELAQRTGVSVETLSVFALEAKKAGVSLEGVETGFKQLARSLGELRSGNQEVVASFAALGLSAADFDGLSLAESMVVIADAQARFADGSGKAALALRIFGRSGEELIPLLNNLANGGFGEAQKRADELGITLSRDAARAADEFNDAFAELGGVVGSFKNELVAALGPLTALVKAATAVFSALPAPVRAFAAAATVAGTAALGLASAIGILTIALKALETTTFTGRAIGLIVLAIATLAGAVAAAISLVRGLKKEIDTVGQTPDANKPAVPTVGDPAQLKALRTAELSALRDHGRDVLALEKALIQQREQLTEQAFARGVTSITEFYAARLQAVKDGIDAERQALEAERNALRGAPLTEDTDAARVQRRREIAAIEAQIARLAVDGETRVLALLEQERQARQAMASTARQLAVELLQAAGQEARASRIQIEEAARVAAETLRAIPGFTAQQIDEIRNAFSTLLTDRAAFDRLNAQASRDLATLERERAVIRERARLGDISALDAQREIAGVERARLPGLRSLVDAMQQFAERVGDPALIEAVEEWKLRFLGMGKVVNEVQVSVANLSTQLVQGVQQSLSQFLGSTINQARDGLDALRLLALGIAQTFQQIFADIAAAQIARLFRGAEVKDGAVALGGSAAALSSSGAILLSAASALTAAAAALAIAMNSATIAAGARRFAAGFASGGYVSGAGTGTSDSILARLSAGEFVVRAGVVERPGMRDFLTALNGLRTPRLRSLDRYGVPKFAEGGLVSASKATAVPMAGRLELEVAHSEDTILRVMSSSQGLKAMVRTVQKNRELFRSVLG